MLTLCSPKNPEEKFSYSSSTNKSFVSSKTVEAILKMFKKIAMKEEDNPARLELIKYIEGLPADEKNPLMEYVISLPKSAVRESLTFVDAITGGLDVHSTQLYLWQFLVDMFPSVFPRLPASYYDVLDLSVDPKELFSGVELFYEELKNISQKGHQVKAALNKWYEDCVNFYNNSKMLQGAAKIAWDLFHLTMYQHVIMSQQVTTNSQQIFSEIYKSLTSPINISEEKNEEFIDLELGYGNNGSFEVSQPERVTTYFASTLFHNNHLTTQIVNLQQPSTELSVVSDEEKNQHLSFKG